MAHFGIYFLLLLLLLRARVSTTFSNGREQKRAEQLRGAALGWVEMGDGDPLHRFYHSCVRGRSVYGVTNLVW